MLQRLDSIKSDDSFNENQKKVNQLDFAVNDSFISEEQTNESTFSAKVFSFFKT